MSHLDLRIAWPGTAIASVSDATPYPKPAGELF